MGAGSEATKSTAVSCSQVLGRLATMSDMTYGVGMDADKPLAWLHGEIKTPPLSATARIEAGYLLRRLQRGDRLSMPQSRPMPSIGKNCHELRVNDASATWRVVYRIDDDAMVIVEVFAKRTAQTPKSVISVCKKRLKDYDDETG